MQENTTKVRNTEQYLRTVLFSAPSTINSYYASLVTHNMATGQLCKERTASELTAATFALALGPTTAGRIAATRRKCSQAVSGSPPALSTAKTGISWEAALLRNVRYSDGTMLDGGSKSSVNDGTPSVDAYYTGFHWTKAACENCGTINSNMDTGGSYCCFCYGTHHTEKSSLERHDLQREIVPELARQRFTVKDICTLCAAMKRNPIRRQNPSLRTTTAKRTARPITQCRQDRGGTMFTSSVNSLRVIHNASRPALTSAPTVSRPGESSTFATLHHSYTLYSS